MPNTKADTPPHPHEHGASWTGFQRVHLPEDDSMTEPNEHHANSTITINRTLGWAVGVLGFIASSAAVAGVTVLWGQAQSVTRIEANYANMSKQLDAMATAVSAGAVDRYRASDAATDRATMLGVFTTSMDSANKRIDQLTIANSQLVRDLSESRVRISVLETRAKP